MKNPFPHKVFSLEVNDHTISPHVRYIAPDNVLHDLYKILNCELVTCVEIQVGGKFFDVWSDDEALLKDKPVPNLYVDDELIFFGSVAFAKTDEDGELIGLNSDDIHLLWDFYLAQFPKLLDFLARQRRHS